MKKRHIKVTIVSIFVIWILMITTDVLLPAKFNRKPLFAIYSEKKKDGGSGTYRGLGYSVDIEGDFYPETETKTTCRRFRILFITIEMN